MTDFFELYDILLSGIHSHATVREACSNDIWTAVEAPGHFGIAMTTPCDTAPAAFHPGYAQLSLAELATACKSWNLAEASFGMAAVNAYYNTPAQLEQLHAYEPFENYCTAGLDLRGKTLGIVGHMNMPDHIRRQAEKLYILERNPQPGDYPDSACDFLLPQCDTVIITASALTNKTMPHLLELCKNSYTIVAGPSCPMCPQLLELGIDRLAGLVITRPEEMKAKIRDHIAGSPYPTGKPFLLKKE